MIDFVVRRAKDGYNLDSSYGSKINLENCRFLKNLDATVKHVTHLIPELDQLATKKAFNVISEPAMFLTLRLSLQKFITEKSVEQLLN